jgi:hypothetical protein
MFIFSVLLTPHHSHPLSLHISTKREHSTGLPVILQKGAARFPMSALNPSLGTS